MLSSYNFQALILKPLHIGRVKKPSYFKVSGETGLFVKRINQCKLPRGLYSMSKDEPERTPFTAPSCIKLLALTFKP